MVQGLATRFPASPKRACDRAAAHWCRASGQNATVETTARQGECAPARNRGHACPKGDSARCAPAPSKRRPRGRSGKLLRRHIPSSSANAGSADRSTATRCSGKAPPVRAQRVVAKRQHRSGIFLAVTDFQAWSPGSIGGTCRILHRKLCAAVS